jgi:hypothetical protein
MYVYMWVCFSISVLYVFQTAYAYKEVFCFARLQNISHGWIPVDRKVA